MTRILSLSLVGSLLALGACNRTSDRATEPAYGEPRADTELRPASRAASAAESITEARCAREQRCENIGDDKKYSSFNDCSDRVRNDWKDDLNARECPGGVNQKELDECLAAIRNEDCNSPFDTLSRLTQCATAPICQGDDPTPGKEH
jgi:hypothetical protein